MNGKLKTLFIFLLTVLRFIIAGRANKKSVLVHKILIFQGGKLGDMICTTPMFRAVREKYPDCKIYVLGNKTNKLVLGGNPDVNEYIVHGEKNLLSTIQKIRQEKIDFACITAPSPLGLGTLYLSGIPHIAVPRIQNGWSPFETKAYKIMSNFVTIKHYMKGNYMPREFLKLLEPIDIFTENTKKYIFWSTEAKIFIDTLISKLPSHTLRVGIMPGAGNKVKQWPAERFAAIAQHLISKHKAHIFIIGNHSNKEEIDIMRTSLSNELPVTDCSQMKLDQTKALISKLDMTVSVDTGPIFIAEASGVPTIDIGGVIHPRDMAPNDGVKHILITYDGPPLLWSMNSREYDYKKARAGIESITVEKVIKEVDALLKKN